ncbi:procollagen C-endopeptidase enhancer 1-like [Lineus longissimus]|uniref:procollagen C-endopeptidase enhancer 1-like n=1 Tax=Lineus longissimus TaxID=88925 RepID=UPI00315D1A26
MYHPHNYNHRANCTWIITVPSRSRILIRFSSLFNIENHPSCAFDSVSLYEDTSSTTPTGKYCHGKPADIISQDNDMVVVFKSDGSHVGRGFSLTWRAIPPTMSGCGSWYRRMGNSGFVSSKNYPYKYQNDADCAWHISVPNGMHVRFEFEGKFEIEPSDQKGCSFDSVVVRGVDVASGELGQTYGIFCGLSAPKTAILTDDKDIAVFFKSDSTTTFAGFTLKWDAVLYACGIPASPKNGRVSLSDYDKVHSKASYSCNIGFKLVGTNRRCLSSGRWTGDPPICQEI